MADLKISELPILSGTDLQADDDLPIADYSASETKRLTAKNLVQSGLKLIDDQQISGSKLENETISADQLADGAVTNAKLAADAVTTAKIADGAVDTAAIGDSQVTDSKLATGIDGAKLTAGSVPGTALADDTISTDKYAPSSVDTAALANEAVTGTKLGAVTNRGLDQTGDLIGITNDTGADTTTISGITYDRQGLITSTAALVGTDLPAATDSTRGAVQPGTGLEMDGTTLNHSNDITAGDIGGLQYDSEGHINALPSGGVFEQDAIPIAGTDSTQRGAVYVPTDSEVGISVSSTSGELIHESSAVTAGTYPRVTVDGNGHVTAGFAQIGANELPTEIPASQIDGTLPTGSATGEQGFDSEIYTTSIADQSISRRHFNDISIAYIQETVPTNTAVAGSDATAFRGCLWFRESTGQLYMFNGNAWHIVAGGQLTQENLRFCGTINANTGNIVALTDEGVAQQKEDGTVAFTAGSSLPSAEDGLSGCYFLVETPGNSISVDDVTGESFNAGDICLAISTANGWTRVANFSGGGSGGGLWNREGSPPSALLTPDNGQDNVDLSGGDFLRLPVNDNSAAPPDSTAGTIRWNNTSGFIEVFTGTIWLEVSTRGVFQWETIPATDNDDWGQQLLRPVSTDSDLGVRRDRSLVFEAGTPTNTGDSGAFTSSLTCGTLTAVQTWTLPNETGTLVTRASAIPDTDDFSIDCGEY